MLIFFAVSWTLGIRVKLGIGIHTIMGAMFFVVAAIYVGASGMNKIHSWWLIPAGFAFVMLNVWILAARIPLVFHLVKLLASVFAGIVRVGIPAERIRAAQEADIRATVEGLVAREQGEE